MNIAFLSPFLSRSGGGIFEIERSLAHAIVVCKNVNLEVYGTEDEFTSVDAAAWHPISVKAYGVFGSRNFRYSPDLRRAFLRCPADIAHLHSLWNYTSVLAREWSRRYRRPYVTTLNGMLDPWALKNSWVKKRLAAILYESRSLAAAACIQVNSEAELAAARAFGLRNPVCIIPNGVYLPTLDKPLSQAIPNEVARLKDAGYKVLLYLGRLHPKKGLANLVHAVGQIADDCGAWVLVIAGWSQLSHGEELCRLTESLGLRNRVVFPGPQYGAAKELVLRLADAFILPSYSEGLPMAVLEAWAHAKPVLMTPACNLPGGYEWGAAIRIEPEVGSIQGGLRQLFEMTEAERDKMGQRGRQLAAANFCWNVVAERTLSVYRWVVSGGPAPDCVAF